MKAAIICNDLFYTSIKDYWWMQKTILARACGVPTVGVRSVDCWQWRSGHYFHPSFPLFFPFFPPVFPPHFFPSIATFSHRMSSRIKNLFCESCLERPNTWGKHLSRPRPPFWGPLAAILDFAGVAGGKQVLPAPLGWYSFFFFHFLFAKLSLAPASALLSRLS